MTIAHTAISNAVKLLIGAAVLVIMSIVPVRADAAELVAVGRASCPYCKAWEIEVGAIYGRTPEARIAPLRRIDIDAVGNLPYRLREPVLYAPTFIVIDGGIEIGRIVGYSDEANFWGELDEVLAKLKPERRAPKYSRY